MTTNTTTTKRLDEVEIGDQIIKHNRTLFSQPKTVIAIESTPTYGRVGIHVRRPDGARDYYPCADRDGATPVVVGSADIDIIAAFFRQSVEI